MLNKVILIGNLATDPELKYTPSGVAVVNFRLAVSRNYTNASGERESDFFTIKAWRGLAEHIANYYMKGKKMAVDGRLESRSYVDKDGLKRTVVEVVADAVHFVDRAPEGGGQKGPGEQGGYDQRQQQQGARPEPAAMGAGPSQGPPAEEDFGDPFADQ
jgi:single-strand DNA-binding protein